MTKIFEALEHAREERGPAQSDPLPIQQREAAERFGRGAPHRPMDQEGKNGPEIGLDERMASLYQRIVALFPDGDGKTILFIGTRRGEGASELARKFGQVCATRLGKSVLLLDANQAEPTHLSHYGIAPEHGWEECVRNGTPLKRAVHRIGAERFYAGQVSVQEVSHPRVSDLPRIGAFFTGLKRGFDLTLVDAPAATISSDGLALARRLDGVVLVIEAERTRRQVAEKVRDTIEEHGGNLLGAILNKRRYPIPAFIYNRI